MKTKISGWISFLWLAGFFVLLLAFGKMILPKFFKNIHPLPVLGQVADFRLTERSGKEISLQDLKGKPWIADFIFTRCAGICPMMSGHMRKLQDSLKKNDIRFVSFSVDPEYDNVERLKEYAARFQADPEKWFFLTGDKKVIFNLSLKSFYLGVGDVAPGEEAAPDQVVTHSSRFALVDADGAVRGYYDGDKPEALESLLRDIRKIS